MNFCKIQLIPGGNHPRVGVGSGRGALVKTAPNHDPVSLVIRELHVKQQGWDGKNSRSGERIMLCFIPGFTWFNF